MTLCFQALDSSSRFGPVPGVKKNLRAVLCAEANLLSVQRCTLVLTHLVARGKSVVAKLLDHSRHKASREMKQPSHQNEPPSRVRLFQTPFHLPSNTCVAFSIRTRTAENMSPFHCFHGKQGVAVMLLCVWCHFGKWRHRETRVPTLVIRWKMFPSSRRTLWSRSTRNQKSWRFSTAASYKKYYCCTAQSLVCLL